MYAAHLSGEGPHNLSVVILRNGGIFSVNPISTSIQVIILSLPIFTLNSIAEIDCLLVSPQLTKWTKEEVHTPDELYGLLLPREISVEGFAT